MRIAVDYRVANLGKSDGNSAVIRLAVRALRKANNSHEIVCITDRSSEEEVLKGIGISISRPFPFLNGLLGSLVGGDPWYRFRLAMNANWRKADVAIRTAHEQSPFVEGPRLIVIVYDLAFVKARAPEFFPSELASQLDMWTSINVHRADHVVTISDFVRNDVLQTYGLPDQRVTTVQLVHDADVFHDKYEESVVRQTLKQNEIDSPFFLHVGTRQPRKNIDVVEKAFREFCEKEASDHLLVEVGAAGWGVEATHDGDSDTFAKDRILRLRVTSDNELAHIMKGATALVMAGVDEGFGLPALEAMACGTPVLAADSGALPEVVGDVGLLFAPGDSSELFQLMKQISSEGIRASKSALGVARASKFCERRYGEELLAVVSNTVNRDCMDKL